MECTFLYSFTGYEMYPYFLVYQKFILYLLMRTIPLYVCLQVPVDGHLGDLQILAMDEESFYKHSCILFFWSFAFISFEYIVSSEIAR